jgi:HK97 family phage portal protein
MTLFNARTEQRSGEVRGTGNPFENPAVPLSSVSLDAVFGGMSSTESGEAVTPENSMALPTVYRCVGLLSTVIAGCPIRTYRDPGKVEVFPAILDRGNSDMGYTQYELWELVVVHLCLWGNAYVRKIRNPLTDAIVDLQPIHPGRVSVKRDREGNKIFEIKRIDPDSLQLMNNSPLVFTDFEVMHIPGMGYDGLKGLSPIMYAAGTFGTAMAGDKLAARFFSKGSILSGIIKVKAPLTNQAQADSIRAKWLQKMGGLGNAAEVGVLDAATDFQPLTIDPDTMQFLESRRWQTNEIARMFGIPPHLVGDVEKSTSWGTGIETQNTGFVSYTVAGWTNRIEQRISREVIGIRKQYSEFDLDRLLRGSMTERFASYTQGISAGWMTRNEARIKENMQPLDGLDEPILALNMGPGDLALNSGNNGNGNAPVQPKIPETPYSPAPGVGGNGIGGNQQ